MHTGSLSQNRINLSVPAVVRNAVDAAAKDAGVGTPEFYRNIFWAWLTNDWPRWVAAFRAANDDKTDQK